jgi:hypothetical protein
MVMRPGQKKVERILQHFERQQAKVWRLTAEESDDLNVSWWLLWFAFYQDAANPHDAALRKVLGPRYKTYRETHNTLPAVYTGPDDSPAQVDGRSPLQWVKSVLSYLDWRSGREWRPLADRNHPERRAYTDASLQLRQAFYNTPNRPPARFRVNTSATPAVLPMAEPAPAELRKRSSR